MKIEEYFKDEELMCPCGCGTMPSQRSVEMLYALRILIRTPLRITSAARCVDHNADVGGVRTSAHIHGKAFDISSNGGVIEYGLIRIALLVGFSGVGINNNNFVHVDNYHQIPKVWTY